MEETFKISLTKKPLSNTISKKQNYTEIPHDYIEILSKYIKIYQGCWLKYSEKMSQISYSGGYFIDYYDSKVILRNIRKDIFELNVNDYIFYCKNDSPNHEAVKEIIREKEKFSIRVTEFNIEKTKFLARQKSMFK